MAEDIREEDAGCDRCRSRLAEKVAAGADPAQDADLAAHLAACESCRLDLAGMRRAREELSRPDALAAPEGLAARTCARAKDATRAAVRPKRRWIAVLVQPIHHPAARVAAILAIVLSMLPMAWVDVAEQIGRWQRNVMGERIAQKIDPVGERILDLYGGWPISDAEVARLAVGRPPPKRM